MSRWVNGWMDESLDILVNVCLVDWVDCKKY